MATNFPTSLDTLTNPSSGDQLNSPDHAGQHADANDAIEALEAKVGVNGSAVTTSLDFLVTQANAWGGSGFESGEYYGTPSNTNTQASSTRSTGLVSYTPFFCDRTQSFDRIAVRSGGSLTGTVTVRLGIYNNTNKKPSTVLLDAGTVAATAANTVYSITIDQSLSAGWYWLAAVVTATTGTNSLLVLSDVASFNQGVTNASFNSWSPTYTQSGVTGTFATATSLTGTTSNQIMIALRAA